jgi:hypothetical protein
VEKFQWNFSANDYSDPDGTMLSSGAMVTVASKVQIECSLQENFLGWSHHGTGSPKLLSLHCSLIIDHCSSIIDHRSSRSP